MKIAVCEKDSVETSKLTDYVCRYVKEKKKECNVKFFENTEELLINNQDFDAVFINDRPKNEESENAKDLRDNSETEIILITENEYFSVNGYKNFAGYLVKPISYYEFETMLDRIEVKLGKKDNFYIDILTKQGAKKIPATDITYIENSRFNVIYHTLDGDIKAHGSLNDVEKKLTGESFFQLGSFIVNFNHVKKISGNDLYIGTACLPLPYNKKNDFIEKLVSFAGRR